MVLLPSRSAGAGGLGGAMGGVAGLGILGADVAVSSGGNRGALAGPACR